MLCLLYLAQGIPWGFVVFTLSAFLTEGGMRSADTGRLVAISVVPWTFKWAWGPLIDALGTSPMGRRRPWILAAQAGMAVSIGAMLLIPDPAASLGALMALVFVHNVFNSLQDVSVDALAVDLLTDAERGRANGFMYGSKYLGGMVGGAGLGTIAAAHGLSGALVAMATLLLIIMLFPLLLKERAEDALWQLPARGDGGLDRAALEAVGRRAGGVLALLARAFAVRSSWLGAVLVLGLGFGSGVLDKLTEAYFIQVRGWTAEDWVGLAGGWAVGLGLFGSIGGGLLADRFGAKRVIALSATALAWTWVLFAVLPGLWSARPFIIAMMLVATLCTSIMAVSMFALAMGLSWPKVAATQFTAYMALSNLSTSFGHAATGEFGARWTLSQSYLVAAALLCTTVLLLRWIDPGQARRVLGEG
ncbi:MAG: MFS transporter [Proteobacteria bacterium]|nr:MFS transporter [Pseudomonadota bacterium]